LRSATLNEIAFIEHGFGTRHDGDWPESTTCTTVRQIHSNIVIEANEPGMAGEGDALITNRPGLFVAIRTADCVPILLADVRNHAVAAVHAGWRGTVSGILSHTLEKMAHLYGTNLADVRLAMGPAILNCCYEVGPEVAKHFGLSGRGCVDLIEANQRQAVGARVEAIGRCTSCDLGLFYSFRREGTAAGRMVSAIRIRQKH
jgi:YfiH family protein